MIRQLISELETIIRELEASGIDTGIDIARLKEITLSIKNGSGYATMDETQALIGKVRMEISELRTEVRTGDADLRTEIAGVHTEIAGVRTEIQRALREQTTRIIVIMGIMLGIFATALTIVATVVGLWS